MVFEDKTTEELAKEYTDCLVRYEDFLVIAKEVFENIDLVKVKARDLESVLIKRGVKIKNVGN